MDRSIVQPLTVPTVNPPDPTAAISVRGLERRFGDVRAVAGVDVDVARGEVFGFLGPNGAGKSTTIKILCTLLQPTAGTALVAGRDVISDRLAVRRRIGLVFQDPTLDVYLTAEENLRFHAELYGVPRAEIRGRIDDVLEVVGLGERRGSLVGTFSGGMKRRLEIGRGLIHAPFVLFLDEPTVGLDPQTRAGIWEYLGDLRRTREITVFLTTHYMDEAENCDRICIMDGGRIVTEGSPEALKAAVGTDRVRIETADDEAAIAALRARFGVEAAMSEGQVTFHVAEGERFVPRLFAELDVPIAGVSVARPSLDDVFMSWTGRTIRDAEGPNQGNRAAMAHMRGGGRR
jgi:ABC-2 type transport system ATP-binding protein